MDKDNINFKFPLERTHCGIVMGNGNFGAMIWGCKRLHITVNRADFWDHRGGELIVPGTTYKALVETARTKGRGKELEEAIPRETFPDDVFKPQRLPVGRFEFSFDDGIKPVKAVLEYQNGTVTVVLSNGGEIKLDLSMRDPVLLLTDSKNNISGVKIKPSWDFDQSREWLQKYAFIPPERILEKDICGWIQACPEDPSLTCLCSKLEEGYAIALELGSNNPEARSKAESLTNRTSKTETLRYNNKWWSDFWEDTPEICLPDKWFNRFFRYSIYRFAAATCPDGYPCSLQGPWQEEYKKAEWSGDYHFNVNIQEIYTPAFALGKTEHLLPLFDMIESEQFMSGLQHNAKVMFGIDDGLWFTHALDDRGRQCGWLIPGAILDPACGAWTAQLYWNYYRYTGDTDFLRTRAFPFIRGIMRGYEAMLEDFEGRLSIPLAVSAEYGCSNPEAGEAGRDPSYQLAAAHMLLNYLIEASSVLGLQLENSWLKIKDKLPEYTLIEGKDPCGKNENRIAIWDGQDLDVCHRHHSHLAGIYPFETLNNTIPEQAEVIDNSIDHWILKGMGQWSEWCIPWAAIIYSRLGFHDAPMILLNMWKEVFVNEGLATVYLPQTRGIVAHRRHDLKKPKDSNEFIQLDGTMGAVSAIIEMLVHQRDDTIYLFEGIPDKWSDVSFKDIHLPGGFLISAQRKSGKTINVSIKSRFDGNLRIKFDQGIKKLTLSANEEISLTDF